MKEHNKILENIGLTQNESKLYIALLRSGCSTADAAAKESTIHRSNSYDALERLVKRGLASTIVKNNKRYFQAADPECLFSLLKDKESRLKEILPTLGLNKSLSRLSKVQVFEGLRGIKTIKRDISSADSVYSFGAEIRNSFFHNHTHNSINMPTTTVVYGNKIAFLVWDKPYGVMIEDEVMAESYRTFARPAN